MARANRDFLRGVYSVVKDSDAHVRFTFLTGVSKFSKVSLFSGLNNLTDITLDPSYSAICGYTDADLDTVFAPELPGLDRDEIRRWYNGYDWLGGERVYNPFDILLLFRSREFAAHWFRTGTPTFLVETLVRRGVSTLGAGEDGRHRRPAVHLRRGRHGDGGAAVPDRLPHHPGPQAPGRPDGCTGSAIRTRKCARASTTACRATWPGIRRARWPTASGSTNCSKPTTSRA